MNKKFNYLRQYIVDLDEFRKEPASLIAAEIFFHQGEYAWVIKEIKDYMQIPYKIKVVSDKNLKSLGAFQRRMPFPRGKELEKYTFKLFINLKKIDSFEHFVMVMSHELSHLLLYSYNNGLGHKTSPHVMENGSNLKIEKATDITSILIGFGSFIKKGRKQYSSVGILTTGYLSDEEFDFIYDVFINKRKFRIVPKKQKTKKSFWKRLFG